MIEDDFHALIDPVLRSLGSIPEEGEEFRTPALDVLHYYRRSVRLHWAPVLGRGLSVVAVVRQPVDLGLSSADCRALLTRLAMAANGRYPPSRGLVIGLTAVVLTPEAIGPEDDTILGTVLGRLSWMRAVPLGVIRLNLAQEAISFALTANPDNLFPEPAQLADALMPHFRRFVPLLRE